MKELMEQFSQDEPDQSNDQGLQAKLDALRELHGMMTELLEGDMQSMEEPEALEVEVMAENEEGLEEGLDMAQQLMKKKDQLM